MKTEFEYRGRDVLLILHTFAPNKYHRSEVSFWFIHYEMDGFSHDELQGYDTEYEAKNKATRLIDIEESPMYKLLGSVGLIGHFIAFHGTFFDGHTRYHIRPVLFAIDAGTTAPTLHE